jgi:hypothetical protein
LENGAFLMSLFNDKINGTLYIDKFTNSIINWSNPFSAKKQNLLWHIFCISVPSKTIKNKIKNIKAHLPLEIPNP